MYGVRWRVSLGSEVGTNLAERPKRRQVVNYDENTIIELLWDSLRRDPTAKNRVMTGWGTKTKTDLTRTILRVASRMMNQKQFVQED